MAERNIDTDTDKDRKEQKQGTGVQAATDKRDESIVSREEGGAVEHKTPGPGKRRGDKHDLPLDPGGQFPAPKKTTITVEDAQISTRTEGSDERKGSDRLFADMDNESFAILASAIRAEAGSR